jgi:hypothetical protein
MKTQQLASIPNQAYVSCRISINLHPCEIPYIRQLYFTDKYGLNLFIWHRSYWIIRRNYFKAIDSYSIKNELEQLKFKTAIALLDLYNKKQSMSTVNTHPMLLSLNQYFVIQE